MKKFQNKYRIPSARAQWWDYGNDGAYFITICTKDRECCFGDVVEGKMQLSHLGLLADVFWYEIKNHAKNITLDAFQVMPNHIHGILILNGNKRETDNETHDVVETTHALSLPETPGQKRYQHQGSNTISSITGSYKSAVTKHADRLGYRFEWQERFYDIIIRDEESYRKIVNYIKNNPAKWEDDKFNPSSNKT